jgi:hypothetical protein
MASSGFEPNVHNDYWYSFLLVLAYRFYLAMELAGNKPSLRHINDMGKKYGVPVGTCQMM